MAVSRRMGRNSAKLLNEQNEEEYVGSLLPLPFAVYPFCLQLMETSDQKGFLKEMHFGDRNTAQILP